MCIYDRATKDMAFSEGLKEPPSYHLPQDVIEQIFALLPLKEKLVCRSVCRSWNSILSTDHLLTYTSNTSSSNRSSGDGNAYFLLTTKGPVAYALDPLANIWHKLQQPACLGASVLAAAHGLVCVGNQVSECRSLIVFNLLSDTRKVLPNMLRVGLLHKVTMVTDPLSHSYVVVVTGEDTSKFRGRRDYRLLTEVYDSSSGSWRMAEDAMPDAKFGSDPGVWHNGVFYCITELPYGITAFNLAKGRWTELHVDMPICISHPSLVSCMGRLMMVGIQDSSHCKQHVSNSSVSFPMSPLAASAPLLSSWLKVTSPQSSPTRSTGSSRASQPPVEQKVSVTVWSLVEGKRWVAISEMPEELSSEFMAHLTPSTPLVSAGVGDKICVTSHKSPQVVVVDLKDMGWIRMAGDPAFPRNRDAHLLAFTVQPNKSCLP